jgi:transposase InsO family protein
MSEWDARANTAKGYKRAGWLYLVSVMDLFSRQVVGWAMDIAIRRARPAGA